MKSILFLFLTFQLAPAFTPPSIPPERLAESYDVIIAGAGTGGCGAAIQAARLGASVLLLDETDYIGGQMNAAAVTSMDEGGTSVRERGIYKELVGRIEAHYQKSGINAETAYWFGHICVEPHIGREILHQMLSEAKGGERGKVDVSLRSQVTKVSKEGDLVTGAEIEIVTEKGRQTRSVKSRFLVDATEWGDVLPLAGARYRAGNTTSDTIDPNQRIQDITWAAVVRKYKDGVPDALKLKQAPPGYTPKIQELFVKTLKDSDEMGANERPWSWFRFIGYRGMPDGKMPPQREITRTHLNYNNDYQASVLHLENRGERVAMERRAILKTLQLLYYIQTTLGKTDWSVADDEGYDTPYNRAQMDAWIKEQPELEPFRSILYQFPVMAYARESRRMFGAYTLKAGDIEREKGRPVLFPDSIAVGDYAVDLHGSMTPKYMELDLDREQDIPDHTKGKWIVGPFAIPYRSLIPEKVDGFLAAEKNFSQSRLGNGATRLQPHTMLIGQAVGATAALSIKYNTQPRKLDPAIVQSALLDAGDILFYPPVNDLTAANPEWNAVQLVATHGLMTADGGKFRPKEPVSDEELNTALTRLDGKPSGKPKESVTRQSLAGALSDRSEAAKVAVKFSGSEGDKALSLTRSEAAQVLAEFLTLRALAATTGEPQTLSWTSVRPASDPTANGDPALRKSLGRLRSAGIIESEDYWLQHAMDKEACDGSQVKLLINRAAAKLSPGDTRHPVDILVEKRAITAAGYWKLHAKEGDTCLGKNVALLIRGISRQLR